MAILSVHLGHWRALEKAWLEEFRKTAEAGTAAVVTAGSHQSKRLANLVAEPVSGTRFFPGVPLLAEALAGVPVSLRVSVSQSIALAYRAGYDVNSAAAAARFFENLIENGITADMFNIQAASLREPEKEVSRTALRFLEYQNSRDAEYPFTPDSALRNGPAEPLRYRTYMFYGYYDLNPGQRSYIRKLATQADILWFSPVHPSHHWRKAFERTLHFLENLYRKQDLHRADGNMPLPPMAQFAENLLTGKALQKTKDISLKRCGSGTAFTSAVVREIKALNIPPGDAAVVAAGDRACAVRTELYCANIPCDTDLTAKASQMPWGRFLTRLNALADNDFHHTDIEKLLETGMVSAPGTPCAAGYGEKAQETGARFGMDSMAGTGFPFGETIHRYYSALPEKDLPLNFLTTLAETLRELCPGSIPEFFYDVVLSEKKFITKTEVPFPVFRKMVEAALDEPVRLACRSEHGIRILSPEKVRGTCFRAVILTGMEEGRFPGRTIEDPRLPASMKKLLEMPSPDNRETEEAFLLRQVFEAALEKLVILAENTDEKGNSVALSPFLARLRDEKENPWKETLQRENIPSMPSVTLSIPENPPFLSASLEAQKERALFDSENPSPDAVHCGITGPGFFAGKTISATLLENYLRNPFSFLMEEIWKTAEQEAFPVRSEPHPLKRGILIHTCVELALSMNSPTEEIVRSQSRKNALVSQLGSKALAEIWISHTVKAIENLRRELNRREWRYKSSETSLRGTVSGFPARGRIDLMFTDSLNGLILADLKTGRPGKITAGNMLKKNRLQLPFYRKLADRNGLGPISSACYIHLEGNGKVTIESVSREELDSIDHSFEEKVVSTVTAMKNGFFHPKKEWKENRR